MVSDSQNTQMKEWAETKPEAHYYTKQTNLYLFTAITSLLGKQLRKDIWSLSMMKLISMTVLGNREARIAGLLYFLGLWYSQDLHVQSFM